MSAMEAQERRASKKSELLERLHDPTQLRVLLTVAVLGIGYAAIYTPLETRIAAARLQLADARMQLSLADDVEQLRKQFRQVEKRLPKEADADEWVQYLLAGIRRSPLKLDSFSPGVTKPLGPMQTVMLKIKLIGSLADLDQFLQWLESNERLFRVDTVSIVPGKDGGDLGMEITVIGAMG
jgi:Tfp pilus assembly protein PilO